jgi:hypothetical protein
MKRKAGTFQEFKEHTLAVARGERQVDPIEPKVLCERIEAGEAAEQEVQFASLEAGAKLLSAKTAPSCASLPKVSRNRSPNWPR